jgi:hypothetical protein
MGYSCTDFTDDMLDAFINHKLLHKHKLPHNDVSVQADRVLDALDKLVRQRDQMLAALQTGLIWAEKETTATQKEERARIAKLFRTTIARTN